MLFFKRTKSLHEASNSSAQITSGFPACIFLHVYIVTSRQASVNVDRDTNSLTDVTDVRHKLSRLKFLISFINNGVITASGLDAILIFVASFGHAATLCDMDRPIIKNVQHNQKSAKHKIQHLD